MDQVKTILKSFLFIIGLFTFSQVAVAQHKDITTALDLENLKKVIEIRDSQNNFKSKFKYLVVWKQEEGVWKLYRDIGL